MHAYVATRVACEAAIRESGMTATTLRAGYVLIPFYWLAEQLPATRNGTGRSRHSGGEGFHCATILIGAFPQGTWWSIIFDPTLKNEGVGPWASVRWSLPGLTLVDGP